MREEMSTSGMLYKLYVVGLTIAYLGISSALIFFNKWLISEERYPYAVPLVTGHMGFTFASLGAIHTLQPSLFPSMTSLASQSREQVQRTVKWLIAISLLFSVQLCLTNMAYLKSSVAFLQMMKEGNVVLVYLFSLALALDNFQPTKAVIICCVIGATSLTIRGELEFSLAGAVIQGSSQFMETSKLILQSIVLGGMKFDPLSYNLIVAPTAFILLSTCLVFITGFNLDGLLAMPTSQQFLHWLPYLFMNAVVALSLNVVMAVFIKHTSAIALVLAGIIKDTFIVLGSHFFLGEPLSGMQAVGFTFQLISIFIWAQVKSWENETKPEKVEQKPIADVEQACEAFSQNSSGTADCTKADIEESKLK